MFGMRLGQMGLINKALAPANSATAWYFAQNGLAGTPWNNLSRTGLGTRIDSAGLVGYGPHNLLLRSDDFSNVVWSKNRGGWWNSATVAADFAADRNGLLRADKVTAPAAGSHGVLQQISATPNTAYTFSAWVKDIDYGAGLKILSTTALGGGAPVAVVASITFGADWTFVTGTATTGPSDTSIALGIGQDATNSSKSFLVVDAQINLGGLTDSVPTTTAARYLPRITYNPSTLASQGLLVEGAATNLVSTNLANWTSSEVTRNYTAGVAPDGTNTAVKLVPSAVSGIHQLTYPAFTGVNGNSYTYRWFIKAAEYSRVAVWANGESKGLYINATTGAITNQSAGVTVLENFLRADGWRVLTLTFTQTVVNAVPALYCVDNSGSLSFAGNGTNGVLVWEPDYVVGTAPSSHIPNAGTGTAVRVADSAGPGLALTGDALAAAFPGGVTAAFTGVIKYRKGYSTSSLEALFALSAGGSRGSTDWFGVRIEGTQARTVTVSVDGALTGTLVHDGATVNTIAYSVDPTSGKASISVNGAATVEATGCSYTGVGTAALIYGSHTYSAIDPIAQMQIVEHNTSRTGYMTGSALQALSV